MNPPKSILDKSFRYRDSAHTDVAETFRRWRDAQRREKQAAQPAAVTQIEEGRKARRK